MKISMRNRIKTKNNMLKKSGIDLKDCKKVQFSTSTNGSFNYTLPDDAKKLVAIHAFSYGDWRIYMYFNGTALNETTGLYTEIYKGQGGYPVSASYVDNKETIDLSITKTFNFSVGTNDTKIIAFYYV